MADEITRLTELLARDPSNIAFRQLAELLRLRGDLDAAQKVAVRGLERHTLDAEAHALLARICVDRGELQRAFDEWDMALRLSPLHAGALKGLAFITYRWGRLEEAERYLMDAVSANQSDASLAVALSSVRNARASLASFGATTTSPPRGVAASAPPLRQAPSSSPARSAAPVAAEVPKARTNNDRPAARPSDWVPSAATDATSLRDLFRAVTAATDLHALLVDADGLVVAGKFVVSDGSNRAQEIGAELSGLSDEANRAMRHLQLGDWKSITFESASSAVAMARAGGDSLVVVASEHGAPLGLLRRVLERAEKTATSWLEGAGGSAR